MIKIKSAIAVGLFAMQMWFWYDVPRNYGAIAVWIVMIPATISVWILMTILSKAEHLE